MVLKIKAHADEVNVPTIQEPSRKAEAYMVDLNNWAKGLAAAFVNDPTRLDTLFYAARKELQKLRTKK
jgi:hypothetical protein